MIIIILSIILISLAVLERILYVKRNDIWSKIRLFIWVLIFCLLFLISFLITDSTTGMFYVFLSISTFVLIGIVNRINIEWIKYTSNIIGLPIMAYLLIKAIQNMLIDPKYIFLLTLIINSILIYPYTERNTSKKQTFSFIIGMVLVITLMFGYYKFFGFKDRIMLRQEMVPKRYLEEELGMHGFYFYTHTLGIKLRGEEITVKAYNTSMSTSIEMIYKNGRIISYDVKDD